MKKSEAAKAYIMYYVDKQGYGAQYNRKTKKKSRIPGGPKVTREPGYLYYMKNGQIHKAKMKHR